MIKYSKLISEWGQHSTVVTSTGLHGFESWQQRSFQRKKYDVAEFIDSSLLRAKRQCGLVNDQTFPVMPSGKLLLQKNLLDNVLTNSKLIQKKAAINPTKHRCNVMNP